MAPDRETIVDEELLREQFVAFSRTICAVFPREDIRLTWEQGSTTVRIALPAHSKNPSEFQLDCLHPQATVHQAIFAIKEMTKAFDS